MDKKNVPQVDYEKNKDSKDNERLLAYAIAVSDLSVRKGGKQ